MTTHIRSTRSYITFMFRMMAWLTAIMMAVACSLGAVLAWRIAGHEVTLMELGISRTTLLIVYGLGAICPWWALLTVMFHKLGWLSRPRNIRPRNVRPHHGHGGALDVREARRVHHSERYHPPALMR